MDGWMVKDESMMLDENLLTLWLCQCFGMVDFGIKLWLVRDVLSFCWKLILLLLGFSSWLEASNKIELIHQAVFFFLHSWNLNGVFETSTFNPSSFVTPAKCQLGNTILMWDSQPTPIYVSVEVSSCLNYLCDYFHVWYYGESMWAVAIEILVYSYSGYMLCCFNRVLTSIGCCGAPLTLQVLCRVEEGFPPGGQCGAGDGGVPMQPGSARLALPCCHP